MNAEKNKTYDVTEFPANDNIPQHLKPPAFDPTLFEDDLTDHDMNEEWRLQFLSTLWDIMQAFADLGWGNEPTQAVCGQLIKNTFNDAQDSPDTVELEPISQKQPTLRESFGNQNRSGKQ